MRILLLNQCFYPDNVATAQHLSDLALGLIARGHEVEVIASQCAYDSPSKLYPKEEVWQGIEIQRIPTLGLGKKSILHRIGDALWFWLQAFKVCFFTNRPDVILSLTSPPLISVLGSMAAKWHGCKAMVWMMDMNPDQAVVSGVLKQNGIIHRLLETLLAWSLAQCSKIFVLDRFMQTKVHQKGIPLSSMHIDPPWSHNDAVEFDPIGREKFRKEHGVQDRFVVMYSGNHSPCHPLQTLLDSALKLRNTPLYHFMFIGGGAEFQRVKQFRQQHELDNITCLPYQPLETLSHSLSAADLHTVVMGNEYVGIVHPCKIYNILALGLPTLFIGPEVCHVTDLASQLPENTGIHALAHGDVEKCIQNIQNQAKHPTQSNPSLVAFSQRFSHSNLCTKMISEIEKGIA